MWCIYLLFSFLHGAIQKQLVKEIHTNAKTGLLSSNVRALSICFSFLHNTLLCSYSSPDFVNTYSMSEV
jgi:hypothetical protein